MLWAMAGAPNPDQDVVLRLLAGLRATRHYLPEPVPRDAVARMLEVARWTGSARNRQPWRLAVVEDRDDLRRLSRTGPYAQHLAGAPLAVVVGIDHARGGLDAEFDAGRLGERLMLAASALGLGSCPATLVGEARIAEATAIAGFEPPFRARTAIAIGRPAPAPRGRRAIPTGRLPLSRLVVPPPP
jgi:nitroreductase